MVNWNSRMVKVGSKFPISLEVIEVRSENGRLIVTAKMVDLPVGVSGQNVVLSGVPDNSEAPRKK